METSFDEAIDLKLWYLQVISFLKINDFSDFIRFIRDLKMIN